MIKASVIAALCIPVLCAAAPADYSAEIAAARQQADNWQGNLAQVREELNALGVDMSTPSTSAEIPETEDTVAVADRGLLFDTANSRLIYLGNVRLRDARAHLNAAEQLQIHLQDLTDDSKEAPEPEPQEEGHLTKDTESPAAPAGEDAAKTEAVTAKAAEGAAQPTPTPAGPAAEPALINTHSAIADTINNAILLYAPAAGEDIYMQQGENHVRITPASDAAARILADPQGNILLEGSIIDLRMVDKDGGVATLNTKGGPVFYHAATHTLYAPGSSVFSHPDGTLTCTESLGVVLKPAETQAKEKEGFMSQFTGLRFNGISTATAKGQVVLTGVAKDEHPAMRAEGDTLTYHGETGECSLEGTKCRLTYGQFDVHADEGLHLLANGDIELRGKDIHGTYERESGTPGQMLSGNFKANAHVIFKADTGIITTEKGIFMQDDEMDFSCTGPAQLELSPKEGAVEPEQKAGMPNLAITRYGDVSRAKATGNVVAHRFEPGTRKCIGELKAAIAETDLETGETLLTGEPGEPLIALYEGNRIVATPAAGQAATMQLLANGDLKLNGATIDATMVNENGTTTAKCRDYVRLIRAEDRLETGSSTELHAPTAILTTNSSLSAKLASSGKERKEPAPGKKGFGRFQFDYTGIQEATTEAGCTLRTEQGSMQCTGPVHIVMEQDSAARDTDMGGLKYATAAGNVAVAGKDSTGRLIRATGDLLRIDSATGMKILSGKRVTLSDARNTHIITGKNAAIHLDGKNNVKITGSSHKTHASNVRQQLNTPQNKKSKK
ncbi:MAG: hypothetical protein IJN23_01655 [Akkermansia sp.]|nr:hypothetical protein [Akkermansia sp.]